MRVKQFTKRKNKSKLTKKNNKRNNKGIRKTRKGGMWRLKKDSQLPQAKMSVYPEDANAEPYDDEQNEFPKADAEYVGYGEYDNPTREQALRELYEDIYQKGFPDPAEQKHALLKQYPEFDINIKAPTIRGYKDPSTMLHEAFLQSAPVLARSILNHPNISEETLENELEFINNYIKKWQKLPKTQTTIKQLIEEKLQFMRDNKPSAPPLEENFEPSAPPMPSSYQIDNPDTGMVGDISNLPNAPSQQPLNLPNVPSHQPILLPNAPKKSKNIISRIFGYK